MTSWSVLGMSWAWADDRQFCRAAIQRVEAADHIPDAFLSAIGRVESGRPDPDGGRLTPWPWTINAEGKGAFFATKSEVITAIRALQARGVRSIDVGCLQVNLVQHPEAFVSLEQALDPDSNASFAGKLLISLFEKMRSWPLAAAAYHSQTRLIGSAYQQRVLAEWAVPEIEGKPKYGDAPKQGAGPDNPFARQAAPLMANVNSDILPAIKARTASAARPSVGRATPYASRTTPPKGTVAAIGRSLANYRLTPTTLAWRPPVRPG